MWVEESLLVPPAKAQSPKRGHPLVYTDALIQGLPGLKQVFHLPPRVLQGFAQSLRTLAFPTLPVPNYTTLSCRAQNLNVVLPISRTGEPLHLVIDSTGLKLYGEGEWKVRKHGWSKRRTWRKVHLAMDANTGQICAALMTHQDVGDGEVLADLLDQIPLIRRSIPSEATAPTTASRATRRLPREVHSPRFHHAMERSLGLKVCRAAAWRNEAIDVIEKSSRHEWKAASGNHRRSLAETLMYRLKTLTGHSLWAREIGSQAAEVAIRAGVLNRMVALARPKSVRIT